MKIYPRMAVLISMQLLAQDAFDRRQYWAFVAYRASAVRLNAAIKRLPK